MPMFNLVIKNANIVLPDTVVSGKSVCITNGKIADVTDKNISCDNIIDANGGYLLAGFIDTHIHGGGGADFMDATITAFETAVKAHLQHGTTLLLPTAMTASEEDLAAFLNTFKEFKKTSLYAKLTPGVHLEGPYFSGANPKSAGAQKATLLRYPDLDEINRLLKIADGDILRWDAAPELPNSDKFANVMRDNGIICSMAHSFATAEEALIGIENGFNHATHFYNALTTYHKRDQVVCGGVVEAAYLDDNVVVELISDGCHIPRSIMLLALKIKGPEKVCAITDGMRLSATDIKSGKLGSLKNGTEVIVEDGVAKLPDRSSFAGSICTMDRALKVICEKYGIDITVATQMLSLSPAKLLGLDKTKGSIEIGKDADLVITDKNLCVTNVVLGGKKVK